MQSMLCRRYKNYLASRIRFVFPPQKRGRPQKLVTEHAIESIFTLLRTGMQWRELKSKCTSSYSTLNRHFKKWYTAGIFHDVYVQMLRRYARTRSGMPAYYCIDSTFVKNQYGTEGVGRNPADRGRRALKLSAIVDQNGVMYGLTSDPANIPDVSLLESTLQSAFVDLEKNTPLLADKGYDSRRNRNICVSNGLLDRISRRRARTGRRMNGKRSIVERCFSWIDKHRRLIMQYERTPLAHLSLVLFCCSNLLSKRFHI